MKNTQVNQGRIRSLQVALLVSIFLLAIGGTAYVGDRSAPPMSWNDLQSSSELAFFPTKNVAPNSECTSEAQQSGAAISDLPRPWTTGEPLTPKALFSSRGRSLDKNVLDSNPQLYLFKNFDPAAEHILIIGMPGWGGRSENFIWTMINGLNRESLTSRLVVASIQDTGNGGPRYQGQGDRAHANVWSLTHQSIRVMRHFVAKVSSKLNRPKVYFMGYSTGGTAAPVLATRVGQVPAEEFLVAGSIAFGTGSGVNSRLVKEQNQRVLFITVPKLQRSDGKPLRADQYNRYSAETSHERLAASGATTYLRHVHTARQHKDWHWGLISQCRFFPTSRIDDGRGYWPNYWKPNPESTDAISAFIQGRPVPQQTHEYPATDCPS